MEEAFYHYQHPDYSSEATPLQLTCKGFGICRHAKTTHLTSLKDCTTVPAAELEKDLRNFILHLFIHYQGPLENAKKKTDLLSYGISTGLWNITEWNLL